MGKKIMVIGAGGMSTAVSLLLHSNGHSVKMWTPFREEADMINTLHEQVQRLPGVKIPEAIVCTTDFEEAARDCDAIVMAPPAQKTRENARRIAEYKKDVKLVITCSKGIEEGTRMILSEVIRQELPDTRVAVLSGPSHAEEMARGIPTVVVAASEDKDAALFAQDLFMSPNFRVYTNTDIVGVELGGALKNIIALCAGISDGLGFGDNTKAALMTRGMLEISRLGIAMGARPETFAGLTGIGDLIVTCTSMHSRNRRAGILIGKGKSVEEALEEVGMVVEGVSTVKPAYELSKEKSVSMPITEEAYNVLFRGKDPRQAVTDLMLRDRKSETGIDDREGWF